MSLKEMLINLDTENIRKIYITYRQSIFLFVLGIVKNYDISEDITEEVFMKIIKYHKTYKRSENPKTWIFTIAKNTAYTFLKKNSRMTYDTDNLENIINQYNQVTDDNSLVVEEYLSYLNEDERSIVILHIFGGLNCLEISKLLKLSHSTVRSKYSYALKKLKRRINK